MQRRAHSGFSLLAAGILLLGQGAALHHQHEIAADCPPGPCLEHGVHDGVAPTRSDAVSEADRCPFCELLCQGRSSAPAAAPAIEAAPAASVPAVAAAPTVPTALDPGAARARAPPPLV